MDDSFSWLQKGGTDSVEVLRLSGSEGFVWNDQSKDVDFRVESNGNTHMIHVDAGNDKVGIGGTPNSRVPHILRRWAIT